jgi:hypothetical protein
MSTPSWDAVRTPIAFLVAPLAVPFLLTALLQPPPGVVQYWLWPVQFYSAIVAYAGVVIFGVPIFLLLRKRKLTAFWIAPLAGFIVGMIMIYIGAIMIYTTGPNPLGIRGAFSDHQMFAFAIKFAATPGAVVGAILWVIARPDLRAEQHSPSGQGET